MYEVFVGTNETVRNIGVSVKRGSTVQIPKTMHTEASLLRLNISRLIRVNRRRRLVMQVALN